MREMEVVDGRRGRNEEWEEECQQLAYSRNPVQQLPQGDKSGRGDKDGTRQQDSVYLTASFSSEKKGGEILKFTWIGKLNKIEYVSLKGKR